MNSKHRKTLVDLFKNPANGALEWARIEALLVALECRIIEGNGSAVTFEKSGFKFSIHRPHPYRESLRYRVLEVRDFLQKIGEVP
jgi:hypothetical protein